VTREARSVKCARRLESVSRFAAVASGRSVISLSSQSRFCSRGVRSVGDDALEDSSRIEEDEEARRRNERKAIETRRDDDDDLGRTS
jgi:hypothetical protein